MRWALSRSASVVDINVYRRYQGAPKLALTLRRNALDQPLPPRGTTMSTYSGMVSNAYRRTIHYGYDLGYFRG